MGEQERAQINRRAARERTRRAARATGIRRQGAGMANLDTRGRVNMFNSNYERGTAARRAEYRAWRKFFGLAGG